MPSLAPMARPPIVMPSKTRSANSREDHAVLERARLALVGVADDVLLVALLGARRSSTSCRSGSRRRRVP